MIFGSLYDEDTRGSDDGEAGVNLLGNQTEPIPCLQRLLTELILGHLV